MQNDSIQPSTSSHIQVTQKDVSQESPVSSYQCSHCSLIFRSRLFLFEHLNKVHGYDVDMALKNAGLKQRDTNRTTDAGSQKCQHCNFISRNQETLKEHERYCQRELDKVDQATVLSPRHVTESPSAQNTAILMSQPNGDPKAQQVGEAESPSKNLKIYRRPSQTVGEPFMGTPGAKVKVPLDKEDGAKETLVLKASPQTPSLNSQGVFKVTAKNTQINILKYSACNFLHRDPLIMEKLKPIEQTEHEKQAAKNVAKRKQSESTEGSPPKRAKSDTKAADPSKVESQEAEDSLSSANISFEVSDDEAQEENVNDKPLYFCKHCDYSDVDLAPMVAHYQDDHPYVRHNTAYIQDSGDQSATFRCLQCPVEFSTTACLRRHYMERHPEGPDVFTVKSSKINKAFKCFLCSHITSTIIALKDHYKDAHPKLVVGDSLSYCRYLVTGKKKLSTQLNQDETPSQQRKSGGNSSESIILPSAEIKTLPQQPTLKVGDTTLYKCTNCTFIHKSVIVMHVHYQKSHPEEAITIDKIKLSARIGQQETSQNSSNSTNSVTATVTTTHDMDSAEKRKDKTEVSNQRKIKVLIPKCELEPLSIDLQRKTTNMASVKKEKVTNEIQSVKEEMSLSHDLSASLLQPLFYCQCCSYTSPKARSVLAHHYAKHASEHLVVTMAEIVKHSSKMRKAKTKPENARESTRSFPPNTSEPVEAEMETLCEPDRQKKNRCEKSTPYRHVENLFYCIRCHFASPSTKGVLHHQSKMHKGSLFSSEDIIQYSALVVKKIKKSKYLQKHLPFYSGLPLPLMLEGDEHRFFCHFCNYRHEEKNYITQHCKKSHGAIIQVETIEKYSAFVRKNEQKSHVKMTVKDDLSQATVMKMIKEEENAESFPVSAPNSSRASQKQRLFQCPDCTYNASYPYLLRRHLGQVHNFRTTASEILNNAYKKGLLQPGYHCEFCIFTHHDAVLFHQHYEQEHPKYFRSFKHVSTHLHVGTTASLQMIKSKPKYQEDGRGAPNNGSLPWPVEHLYSKNSSKDGSKSTAKNKKHPLSSIDHLQSPSFGQKGSAKAPQVFEPYQEPLDFDNLSNEAADPPTVFKCPYCSRVLKSEHNLMVHCKMKHYAAEQQKQVPVKKRVHIFKCLVCAYVHTKYQGVLSHCQKRHPHLKPRADSLHVDMTNSQSSSDEGEHGGPLVISGYMCKTCTVVFKKLDRFKEHCEIAHVEKMTTSNGSSKPSGTSNPTFSKVHSSQKVKHSKASLVYKYKFTKVKCPHCPFVCCSQPRLNRHFITHHRNGNASRNETMVDSSGSSITFEGEKLLAYRCPKCSYVNTRHHGILTHCQMRHPKAKARAYNLKSIEIFLSNIVKSSLGKASNQNGYLCKCCQKIYPSSSKLKIHFMEKHSNGSETWTEPESQPVTNNIQFPTSEADEGQNQQTDFPETILPVPLHTTSTMYNCQMCSYIGLYRRYLQVHYRKTHKLDLNTTFKLLNKYDKVKTKKVQSFSDPTEPEVKESSECIKCPHLTFNSSDLLVDHYSTVHSLKGKSDFIIISTGEKKKTTGVYRCCHCFKQLNGIRKLCIHVNNHRAELKDSFHRTIKTEPEPIELCMPGEVPSLEVGENVSQLITAAAEIDHPSTSSLPSPSELDDQGQPKIGGHLCELCGRMFLSMKGLISHERSHAAVAGLKNLYDELESSTMKPRVEKYLCYNAESGRPFACQICAYRTTSLGLWRRHFNRIHPDLVGTVDAYERTEQDSPKSSEKLSSQDELDEEIEPAECSLYTEPPDVQRQLSHYNMVAQSAIQSRSDIQESMPPESTLFHCELCNFTSEHLSSVRRHYLNRHGRRIYRCKDCNFFSVSKETLEVHVEADHSTPQSERPHQKDFRCPFCLYQTRNKNYMIDHIVLHRVERVAPIEIKRPKLSRYLNGIIFRCHKCTFSCGDAATLGSHMSKHDDVRPYKCRLCFFDCAHLSHLEAHLGDKHQVLRNHELVGQVNLELLEARADRMPELDEECWLNGQENFNHPENGRCPELYTDSEEIPRAKRPKKNSDGFMVQINGTDGKEEENGGSAEPMMHTNEQMEQDAQKPALEIKMMETTIKGMDFKMSEQEQHFNLQCTVLTKEAIEDIILLGEDENKRAKTEQTTKALAADTKEREHSPTETLSDAQVINGYTVKSIAVEKQTQRLPPDDARLKMESEDDLDVSYSKIKREQTDEESEETERFREMPVLENEYLKEKRLFLQCKEEEEDDHVEQGKRKEASVIKESNGKESVGVSEDVESYICDFCGRNLESSADLKRHILRHGM